MKIYRAGLIGLLVVAALALANIPARAMLNYSTYNNQPNETDSSDTYINSGAPVSNYGNAADIYIGTYGGAERRALIKFNLSSIPSDSVVTSATLTLTFKSDYSGFAKNVNIYRSLRDWNETQSTWTAYKTGNNWTTLGAGSNGNDTDFNTVWASKNTTASETMNTPADFVFNGDGLAELQKMINGTYTNNGWLIQAEASTYDMYIYYSSGDATAAYRPKLVVEYSAATLTPSETPTQTATLTATTTPTATVTYTPSETPTITNTPIFTPSDTSTPTNTFTPTNTGTTTNTATVTDTPTQTNTTSPTSTRTPTVTATPGNGVIWATGPVTLSAALQDEIGDLLTNNPPSDAETNIYAATHISGVDTAWNVSLVNLKDVVAPYTDWDALTNVAWASFVECTGAEPVWSCHYYTLPGVGGSGSLRFPWKTGYSALYGVSGVHEHNYVFSGSYAVDFLGDDNISSSMPPLAVAAADGTITWVCGDSVGMAIIVEGGPVKLAYYHFAPGQGFSEGQTVTQGQVLGSLLYGNFNGTSACPEHGTQGSSVYHLHFVFEPTSSGFLEIGGCILDLSTQNFVCNGNTYSKLSWIPNGGVVSDPTNPTPGPGDNPPGTGGGGPHIWDGIVDAIVQLGTNTVKQYLPAQNPLIGYLFQKINLLTQFILGISLLVYSYGIGGILLTDIIIAVITMSSILIAVNLAVTLWKNFGWLLKFMV